jgi:hypothetical protein
MEPLKQEFKTNGLSYRLVDRLDNLALVQVFGGDFDYPRGYEVHKVRVRKAESVFGKAYPEHEIYASNEEFGSYAWSYVTLEGVYGDFPSLRGRALGCYNASPSEANTC